jgi:hypothetical protein
MVDHWADTQRAWANTEQIAYQLKGLSWNRHNAAPCAGTKPQPHLGASSPKQRRDRHGGDTPAAHPDFETSLSFHFREATASPVTISASFVSMRSAI